MLLFSCLLLPRPDIPRRATTTANIPIADPDKPMRNRIGAWTSTDYVQSMRDEIIMLHTRT